MELHSATMNDDGNIVLSSGQVIFNFHDSGKCLGAHCPVHNPTDHEYKGYPLVFTGRNMVRKVSDEKTVIDPDDYEFNKNGYVILLNSAKCLKCGDIVVSQSRHDFNECGCGNIFVDGGLDYLRRGANDVDLVEDISEVFEKEDFNNTNAK